MSAAASAARAGVKRPRVTLKLATSLDGRIATPTGESQWITGAAARAVGHELRGVHGAILVGAGTVNADDPELTARGEEPPARQPLRIVLDSQLRLSLESQLLKTIAFGPVLVAGCAGAAPSARKDIEARGARVGVFPRVGRGVDLGALLDFLGGPDEPVDSLFVEGGGQVAASFLEAGLVDRMEWFRAPLILGENARAAIAGADALKLGDARRWKRISVRELGDDLWETYERA